MAAVTSLSCRCSVGPEHINVGWTSILTVLVTEILRWPEWWGVMIAAGLLWVKWA